VHRGSGDARRELEVIHMPDVWQRVRRVEGRAYGGVGQDVESQPRIGFHPLRVEQRTGGDAEARVERTTEEHSAGAGRDTTHPGDRADMRVVPLIGTIESIAAL